MIFRKAILFVHGFAGSPYDYGELANDLQLHWNYDVYTFTLPGHNKLIINKVKYNQWIEEAEKQIEKLINHGYKQIYVIGHSMGGVIACYLASKYKEVKKLILAAPAFRYFSFKNDHFDLLGSLKKSTYLVKDYPVGEVISRIFKVPVVTAIEFSKLVKKYQNTPNNIHIPVLIFQGTRDNIVPLDSSLYVYNSIHSKTKFLMELEGVTHDVFRSDKYTDILKDITFFLKHNDLIKQEKIIKK